MLPLHGVSVRMASFLVTIFETEYDPKLLL
jgi:hypothetical protein